MASEGETQEFGRLVTAIQQMVQAVEEEGVPVERFNEIAQALQRNESLMQRLREVAGGGGES